jgi:hypothetical protein
VAGVAAIVVEDRTEPGIDLGRSGDKLGLEGGVAVEVQLVFLGAQPRSGQRKGV